MAQHFRFDLLLDLDGIDTDSAAVVDVPKTSGSHFAEPEASTSPEPVIDLREKPTPPVRAVPAVRLAAPGAKPATAVRATPPNLLPPNPAARPKFESKLSIPRTPPPRRVAPKGTPPKVVLKAPAPQKPALRIPPPRVERKPVERRAPRVELSKKIVAPEQPKAVSVPKVVAPERPKVAPVPKVELKRPLPKPGLTASDERWLAGLLDAFDAFELDTALRGGGHDLDEIEVVIPDSLAGIDLGPAPELEPEPKQKTRNDKLDEWLDRPVLERIKPAELRFSAHSAKIVQAGLNMLVAIALTATAFVGQGAGNTADIDNLAASADRGGEFAASRGGSFVSSPVSIVAASQAPELIQADPAAATPPTTVAPPPTTAPPAPASKSRLSNPLADMRVTSSFGGRVDPVTRVRQNHDGIDLTAPTGTNILASEGGTVTKSGFVSGYGNYTCIDHGSEGGKTLSTCYAHQSQRLVKVGDKVNKGQVIGKVGSTGQSTGPHLHFETRLNGAPVDPRKFIL